MKRRTNNSELLKIIDSEKSKVAELMVQLAHANHNYLVIVEENTQLMERVKKLQEFKDYVHKRLDDAGIPVDPDSPHKDKGCRIGGRLDIVLS